MRAVLPVLSDDELVRNAQTYCLARDTVLTLFRCQTSPRGLGVLHASAMGLAGTMLAEQDFVTMIQPTSDDEVREADRLIASKQLHALSTVVIAEPTTTVGQRTISAFEESVSHTVEELQLALSEYFKATTWRSGRTCLQCR